MVLQLTNNLTKMVLTFTVNDNYTSNLYFNFDIRLEENLEGVELKDIDEGEYNYLLLDDGKKIAEGLLQIGDYTNDNKQYKKEIKGFKTYGG